MKTKRIIALCILVAFAAFAPACQTTLPKPPDKAPAWQPKKVVVLPFMKVDPDPDDGLARSPLTGAVFAAGRGIKGNSGLSTLDQALADYLAEYARFQVVPAAQAGHVFRSLSGEGLDSLGLRKIIMQTAAKMGADGVLVGHLYRFDQRVGGTMTAKEPASVAFDVAMLRTSDGIVVWKNSFDEKQRSLTENIFNIEQYVQGGLRWFTAEEFATYGMKVLMSGFPWQSPAKEK